METAPLDVLIPLVAALVLLVTVLACWKLRS